MSVKRHKFYDFNENVAGWTDDAVAWRGQAFAVPVVERGGTVDFVNYDEDRHFRDVRGAIIAFVSFALTL